MFKRYYIWFYRPHAKGSKPDAFLGPYFRKTKAEEHAQRESGMYDHRIMTAKPPSGTPKLS